jgi:hypothetical protein
MNSRFAFVFLVASIFWLATVAVLSGCGVHMNFEGYLGLGALSAFAGEWWVDDAIKGARR